MIMIEGKTIQSPGDRVFEVEWQTLRASAPKGEVDVDRDLETNVKMFASKDAALKAARKIWIESVTIAGTNYWGVVNVTEYVAEAMPHDRRLGTWEPVGDSIEISDAG